MKTSNQNQLPLGRLLGRASRLYLGALTRKLDHLEIDRHYSALMMIERNYPNTSQKELAHHLGVDKATMVRMLNYLTHHGYIIRESEERDKRQHRIRLTSKAATRMKKIHDAVNDLNDFCAGKVNRNEWKIFLRVLDQMRENLLSLPQNEMVFQIRKRKSKTAKQ
ncbi:MAG: MarR family winged helix-turn-helix transcriptional regulator [Chitinophagales bacterium]